MKNQLIFKLVTNQNIKTTKRSSVKEEDGNYTILNEYIKRDKTIKGTVSLKANGIVSVEEINFTEGVK
ncbi:MAG: hypothetical protein L3J56_06125 [Bacteroidales bacterium]|nr:hypothetical protein [Bacteroidales bacterium]